MPTSETILKQLHEQYHSNILDYRDRMLECGRLIHQYILAYLAEADGTTSNERFRLGISRRQAVVNVREALGANGDSPSRILRVAMVVDLFARPLGNIGLKGIEAFAVFVHRCVDGRKQKGKRPTMTPSQSERWEIRAEFAEAAISLFDQAVAEQWDFHKCRRQVTQLLGDRVRSSSHQRRQVTKRRASIIEELHGSVKAAAPGDVAEMIVELVERAESPPAVATRLMVLLQRFMPKREAAHC